MTKKATAATFAMLLTLGACGMMGGKKMADKAPAGISAVDCFSAGGTIDNASGSSMCKMKDGSSKPVL